MTAQPWDLSDDDPEDADWWLEGMALMAAQTVDRVEAARPAWQQQAACRGSSVSFFDQDQRSAAMAICKTCPVTVECRAYGRWQCGVWGGKVSWWTPRLRKPRAA